MQTISRTEARRALIAAQGLAGAPPKRATKAAVLAAIERMAALQIDTISVVARSPYFVLWSRLGAYKPAWLDELLAEGAVFEAWSHAACFVPTGHFPLYRRRILTDTSSRARWNQTRLATHADLAEAILRRLREEGPLKSSDFEPPEKRQRSGWWDWKDEKLVLELLFWRGDLMVARREGFQRVYDLTERVRPEWDDRDAPDDVAAMRELVLASVRALGVTKPEWVWQYLHMERKPTATALAGLIADGAVLEVAVEGEPKPWVMAPGGEQLIAKRPTRTVLLTPFDPIVWDRDRARGLFGFDYTIECYTPEPKRKYGYFSLPILHGDALVGRLDAKAHRKDGVFEVKSLHLEPGVTPSNALVAGLAACLRDCATWHGTPEVVIRRSDPPGFVEAVAAELNLLAPA